jgi:hypothetical protein
MSTTTYPARAESRRLTHLPRTTGALSGILIIALGVWGGLIPFVGPYFHYAFGSYRSWHYSANRLWLDILPGIAAVLGGLILLGGKRRIGGVIGGWLAVAGGAWFAVGPVVFLIWHHSINPIGRPMGGYTRQALEQLGFFYALGVLITALAAFATGRYVSRPRLMEEPIVAADAAVVAHEDRVAARRAPVAADEPVATRDAPVAAAGEPVAARQAPVAASEPVAARDAPIAARDEPVAAREGTTTGVAPRRRRGLLGRLRS